MAYGLVLAFDGVTEEQYWAVNERLGIDRSGRGDYPEGLRVHVGGPTETGWIVIEVWDSKAAQLAFLEGRLGAALAAANVSAPTQTIETETVNVHVRP